MIDTIFRSGIKVLVLLLILFSNAAIADLTPLSDAQYRLASGDIIRIYVFGEPDLSFDSVRLSDAGTFSYPFLGELNANGRTAAALEKLLEDRLRGDYLVEPKVTVSVLEYRMIFIGGEVKKPGSYAFQPGLTLRRAIATAGGLTDRASTRRIKIIRGSEQLADAVTLDTPVMPGDTITIEQGFF